MLTGLLADHEPATELEGRLAHRLAAALWRQYRADRLEQVMSAAAPRPRFVTEGGIVHAAPEETFELARLTAVARYRAEASREVSRILRELRLLRADASGVRKEPAASTPSGRPPADRTGEAGNDNQARPAAPGSRNGPEPAPAPGRQARRRTAALARKAARHAP